MVQRPLFWLALALGAALFAGCGDDDGGASDTSPSDTGSLDTRADTHTAIDTFVGSDTHAADSGTDSTAADTGGPDTTGADTEPQDTATCCTIAQCAALGQTCNSSTCLCEPMALQPCAAAGAGCDTATTQPQGWVCADSPDGGVCAVFCEVSDGVDACAPSGVCWAVAPSTTGYCRSNECDGFFGTDCGTWQCVPVIPGLHVCLANGLGAAGDGCTAHEDCAAGLLCGGDDACFAPDCAPLSGARTCTGSDVCGGFNYGDGTAMDLGLCYTPCDAFTTGSGCEPTEWCFPDHWDGSLGAMRGFCVPTQGTATTGQACSDSVPCAPETACIGEACVALCNAATGSPGGCGSSDTCVAFGDGQGGETDYGICLADCTPWVDACTATSWCFPDLSAPTVGQCMPSNGLVGEGGACDDETDATSCQAGLFCIGECSPACDPAATAGPGASCSSAEACLQFVDDTTDPATDLPLGVCFPSCDFHAGTACSDASLECGLGELFDFDFDPCIDTPVLNPGADCLAYGLVDRDLCGPNALCIDLAPHGSSGTWCFDVCSEAEGAFGGTHPDCRDNTATCTGDPGDVVGLCL